MHFVLQILKLHIKQIHNMPYECKRICPTKTKKNGDFWHNLFSNVTCRFLKSHCDAQCQWAVGILAVPDSWLIQKRQSMSGAEVGRMEPGC